MKKEKKKKKNWVGKLTDALTRQEIVGIALTRVGPHAVARLTIYRP